jgi:hypothetical protein
VVVQELQGRGVSAADQYRACKHSGKHDARWESGNVKSDGVSGPEYVAFCPGSIDGDAHGYGRFVLVCSGGWD